jgi:hypothetical protein
LRRMSKCSRCGAYTLDSDCQCGKDSANLSELTNEMLLALTKLMREKGIKPCADGYYHLKDYRGVETPIKIDEPTNERGNNA